MTFGEFLFVSVVVGVFILLWIHFGQGNSMIKLLVIPLIIGVLLRFTWGIFGVIVVFVGVFCGMADSDSLVPLSILLTVIVLGVIFVCSWRQG
jgi:hypothetical protein